MAQRVVSALWSEGVAGRIVRAQRESRLGVEIESV
jgi:hypothetical protein